MNCGPSPWLNSNGKSNTREDGSTHISEEEYTIQSILASQQEIYHRIQNLEADLTKQIEQRNTPSSTLVVNEDESIGQTALAGVCDDLGSIASSTLKDMCESSWSGSVDTKNCDDATWSDSLHHNEVPFQMMKRKRSTDHLTSFNDNYDTSGVPVVYEHRRAKRRRSTLNFLKYLFDDDPNINIQDHHQPYEEKRNLIIPSENQANSAVTNTDLAASVHPPTDHGGQIEGAQHIQREETLQMKYLDEDHHGYHQQETEIDCEPLDCSCHDVQETVCDFRTRLAYLQSSIEQSLITQQDLTNWDKSMGLKKSHSKTMRSTRKSRAKVKNFLKKTLNSLPRNAPKARKTEIAEVCHDGLTTNGVDSPAALQIEPEMHSQGPKAA